MESWSNMGNKYDAYIQWIEYSVLMNVQEMTSLQHGCTHIADWPDPISDRRELIRVTLKKIAVGQGTKVNYFHANSILILS